MSALATFHALLPVWRNAQIPMRSVTRWGNFPQYGQSLLEHANSFPLVGRWVVAMVEAAGQPLDRALLYDCFMLHDHGEPLTGGDEHAYNKTPDKEQREWEAFRRLTAGLPPELQVPWRRAFALQYVRKTDISLPSHDQQHVDELGQTHRAEAIVFEGSERLDYLFSAYVGWEQGIRTEQETMITHAFLRQAPKLDELSQELPALTAVWTPELRQFLAEKCF